MKALFIKYPQNVSRYKDYRMTSGYKFLETVDNDEQAWQIIDYREEPMIDDDGRTMRTDNGRLVWEQGDSTFDFGDYQYLTFDLDKLQPNDYSSHGNMWTAILREKPWNFDEIRQLVKTDQ